MTILILGGNDDDHAMFMFHHLNKAGHDAELLDGLWFPAGLRLSHDPVADRWSIHLPSGRILQQEQVRSIYWRCYNSVPTPPLPNDEQAYIAVNDARSLFESFLIHFPTRWVNGWSGYLLHQTKPVQLARVARLGVQIPATILTNEAGAVRAFLERVPRAIFKPVQGGAHARAITASHLTDQNLKNLAFAPVTIQEEIPGTNVRVFVAGERILACEIRSESLDYRDTADPTILAHPLSPEMELQCRQIAAALDLVWTGIDFRLTPQGRYVYLEANPSPMFLGFESRCGVPLTDSLTAILTQP